LLVCRSGISGFVLNSSEFRLLQWLPAGGRRKYYYYDYNNHHATLTFCYCSTGLFVSGDHSRSGEVIQRSPEEQPSEFAGVKYCTGRMSLLPLNQLSKH